MSLGISIKLSRSLLNVLLNENLNCYVEITDIITILIKLNQLEKIILCYFILRKKHLKLYYLISCQDSVSHYISLIFPSKERTERHRHWSPLRYLMPYIVNCSLGQISIVLQILRWLSSFWYMYTINIRRKVKLILFGYDLEQHTKPDMHIHITCMCIHIYPQQLLYPYNWSTVLETGE